LRQPLRRIERIGGFAARQPHAQIAALLRPLCARGAGQQRSGEGRRHAERRGAAEEVAAVQDAADDTLAEILEFVGHAVISLALDKAPCSLLLSACHRMATMSAGCTSSGADVMRLVNGPTARV